MRARLGPQAADPVALAGIATRARRIVCPAMNDAMWENRIVQRNAMRAWDEGQHLRTLLRDDTDVGLSDDELEACFQAERFLRNTAAVFDRLEALSLVR